jgi:hypothetical protein
VHRAAVVGDHERQEHRLERQDAALDRRDLSPSADGKRIVWITGTTTTVITLLFKGSGEGVRFRVWD